MFCNKKIRLTFARRISHFICSGKLLVFAQLLVAFVAELSKLFGLGEECINVSILPPCL